MAQENKAVRAGWTYGGLGGLLWMPVLGGVLFVKGLVAPALLLTVCFVAGLACLHFCSPWRHPDVAMGLLYAGLPAIVMVAGAGTAVLWIRALPAEELEGQSLIFLAPVLLAALLPMWLPVFLFWKQTWRSRHQP